MFSACFLCTVGGANTNDALLRSTDFLVRQEESDLLATRVSMILLITNSNPTVGISDPARILSNVRQASGGRVSVNVFVLSADVGRPFFGRLAQQNRGAIRRCCGVRTGGLEAELRNFYRETSSPLLENVRFRYDEQVDERSVTTVDYPAYYEGSELVVVGRLRRGATHLSVKVSGGGRQVVTDHVNYLITLNYLVNYLGSEGSSFSLKCGNCFQILLGNCQSAMNFQLGLWSRGSGDSGVQARSPGKGSGAQSPPEAEAVCFQILIAATRVPECQN